ncbi:MAG: ribose 5-phosphate isomerase B [Clostridia bacterium]|nr:ribose 5-phosphate isomerase B [Clostridia bacterium]
MIAIASDHAALEMKKTIMGLLDEMGLEYKDFGTYTTDSCDYPVFAARAAHAVADGTCDRGILICGTGIGMSLVANKVQGIRCATCNEVCSAELSRLHNDANMIAIGARVIGSEVAKKIVRVWLTTPFEGGRHQRRVDMIGAVGRGESLE